MPKYQSSQTGIMAAVGFQKEHSLPTHIKKQRVFFKTSSNKKRAFLKASSTNWSFLRPRPPDLFQDLPF
jgi:hypothetical protein